MNDLDGTQNQDQAILTIPKSTAVALTGDTEYIQEQELSLYFQNENKSFEQLNDPSEDDFKSHIKSLSKAIFANKNGFQEVELDPEVLQFYQVMNLQSSQETPSFDFYIFDF